MSKEMNPIIKAKYDESVVKTAQILLKCFQKIGALAPELMKILHPGQNLQTSKDTKHLQKDEKHALNEANPSKHKNTTKHLKDQQNKDTEQEEKKSDKIEQKKHQKKFSKHQKDGKQKSHKVKKPPTPYSRFHRDQLESLRSENPNMTPTDLISVTSKMWTHLKPQFKKKYEDEYAKLKEKYEKEIDQANQDNLERKIKGASAKQSHKKKQ